jgi:hypothetical protein
MTYSIITLPLSVCSTILGLGGSDGRPTKISSLKPRGGSLSGGSVRKALRLRGRWTAAPVRAIPLRIHQLECVITMRVYRGTRTETGCEVVVEEGGTTRPLDPRLDLRKHSPTGFEWGYSGSGPAQLALALAADVLGDNDRARDVYQRLKFKLVGGLPREGWELTEDRIRSAVEAIERERGRSR